MSSKGFIYAVREREFAVQNVPYYKVGRTAQDPDKRMSGYPKNSQLLMTVAVNNAVKAEAYLLKMLRDSDFALSKKEIGSETFEINEDVLFEVIFHVAKIHRMYKDSMDID